MECISLASIRLKKKFSIYKCIGPFLVLLTLFRDAKFNFTILGDNLIFVNVAITKPESVLLTRDIDVNSHTCGIQTS